MACSIFKQQLLSQRYASSKGFDKGCTAVLDAVNFTGGSWLNSGLFEVQYCFTIFSAVNRVWKMSF